MHILANKRFRTNMFGSSFVSKLDENLWIPNNNDWSPLRIKTILKSMRIRKCRFFSLVPVPFKPNKIRVNINKRLLDPVRCSWDNNKDTSILWKGNLFTRHHEKREKSSEYYNENNHPIRMNEWQIQRTSRLVTMQILKFLDSLSLSPCLFSMSFSLIFIKR